MKIVLFLGAGFSREYGLPVMREFFNHVKNAPYLSTEDKDFLDNYRRKTYSASDTFKPDYQNLEDVLSFCLALENFAGNYPESTTDDYKQLCRILYEVYRHVRNYILNYWELAPGHLQKFLRLPQAGTELPYELTVITTNYDIVAEYTFWRIGLNFYLPIRWKNINGQRKTVGNMYSLDKGKNPLLCKLHGSLNWFSSGPESLTVEGRIIDEEVDTGTNTKRVQLPLIAEKEYILNKVPLIVPPTVFKLHVVPCLQRIWEAAGLALREADKLVFVGFSFPNSDIYIRYFLAASITENVRLDKILIVDPDADAICKKLKESGSKFGERFKELLKPWTVKWSLAVNKEGFFTDAYH